MQVGSVPAPGSRCDGQWALVQGDSAAGSASHLRRNPHPWRRGVGEGESLGVAWTGAWTGVGARNVELAGLGGGLHDVLDATGRAGVGGEGDTTLGGSCMGTLG